uniref:Major facilitator superfamily (MFS) profile domain-containing protein n=1 Tax=Scylla olivacea TaxID=85551 RepID=A0A0P4WEC6_SCYOL
MSLVLSSTRPHHFLAVQYYSVILFCGMLSQFTLVHPGGRISELMGARETMAVSIMVSGVLCLLTPTMAAIHPLALATLRFAMGIMQGPAFPSLYCVLARWAPPEKLATMTTIAFSGGYRGARQLV